MNAAKTSCCGLVSTYPLKEAGQPDGLLKGWFDLNRRLQSHRKTCWQTNSCLWSLKGKHRNLKKETTHLRKAAREKHWPMVLLLLQFGADAQKKDWTKGVCVGGRKRSFSFGLAAHQALTRAMLPNQFFIRACSGILLKQWNKNKY